MQTHTQPPGPSSRRTLTTVEVPLRPAVVPRLLPAVAAALAGGDALLPLPSSPAAMRDELIGEFAPRRPLEDDVAFIVPTSGSTGRPKGALLSAAAVRASAEATLERLGGPGRWLLALPATHIAGLMVLARSVIAGREPVAVDLSGGFDPELFAAASVQVFAGGGRRYTALVPRQLRTLLDAGGAPLSALTGYDAVLVGGAATDGALLDRARKAGVEVVTTYGMTETCGGCVYDGVPLDGARVELAADGRIRLAGPMLASGYRLRPDLAPAFDGGWFTTSDLGSLDDDGRLTVLGRADDVAVSGGENVPLTAVDLAVASHPDVAEALSVAVPDAEWGERIVVAVVPADAARPPSLDSVRAHIRVRHPVAYAPKELHVLDALPTLPGGKTDRRALAARLGLEDA
ncbi:hypothetical protein E1262_12330 [Jiangella aurantiaca]|uniref:AMP-dependent synthetase n=1 Tax=Jiangella aurantiaca TaxID=2530373 RepID=A0A4R5AH92_9ACTN|nr:o-succinylbenzoate--CoA ligase [Jiangella aurantiaca]TDD69432.1 hypothetical protein E1262_12330 [Jiangella aurantiaca]